MKRSIKGLTLIELMAASLIFLIVFAAIIAILTSGRDSWQIGSAQVQVQQEARRAMESIVRELRPASNVDTATFVNGVSNDLIRFNSAAGQIEFAINVVNFSPDQLVMTQGATNTVVANDVQSVQFDLLGGNVVYITLTTQRRSTLGHLVSSVVTSQVVLRN